MAEPNILATTYQSGGIVFTQGCVGQGIERLLGVSRLPVLMPSTRLAKLIMIESHCEDHRKTPSDALARSREQAWIVRGGKLAKTTNANCPSCRLDSKKTADQLMGDIPQHQLVPCPPFTNISLDFLGPFKVRGLANQRARVKVYGLLIVCQNTRALKLLPVPGYDTGSFLLAYVRYTSNCGRPALIVSDRGTQLVKAGNMMNNESLDVGNWDWSRIVDATAKSGTNWKFVEAGCQWRNGLVERQVAAVKKSMSHILATHQDLNYVELDTLSASIANL